MLPKYDGSFSITTYSQAWADYIQKALESVYSLETKKAPPGEIRLGPTLANEFPYHKDGLIELRLPLAVFERAVDDLKAAGVEYSGPPYIMHLIVWEQEPRPMPKNEPLPGFPHCQLEVISLRGIGVNIHRAAHELSPGGKVSEYANAVDIRFHGLLHHSFEKHTDELLMNTTLLDEVFSCFKQCY